MVALGSPAGSTSIRGPKQAPLPAQRHPTTLKRLPKVVHVPVAKYPPKAKQQSIEGSVLLQVTVNANGRVGQVKVVRGVHPLLDKAAVRALHRARFKPALDKASKPVRYTIRYRYAFRLENS